MLCTVSRERVKWRTIERDRRCCVWYPGSGLSGVPLSKIVGAVYGVPWRVKWRTIEQDRWCCVRCPGSGLSGVPLSETVGAVYGVPGAG